MPQTKPKYIESPEHMYKLFQDYKDKINKNPWEVKDWVGGMAKEVTRKKRIPLTFSGFDVFVMNNEGVRSRGVEQYFTNQDNGYKDYKPICHRIKTEIREDQITGGMINEFNPSITQRLNNISDNTESTVKIEQPLFGDLNE